MTNDDQTQNWTVEAARSAAKAGRLREWMIDFLEGPVGHNLEFVADVRKNPAWVFDAPILFSLKDLNPITGRPEDNRYFKDTNWDERVSSIAKAIADGWSPPPLIATNYYGTPNSLADGNHRWAALLKNGRSEYWTIFFHQI